MPTPIEINGAPDLVAECKKWERQCAELIEERDRLRDELAKARAERDLYGRSLFHLKCKDYVPPVISKEDQEKALAKLDNEPSILDLIAELEGAGEK
jgi:hypothetical protein